MKYNEADLLSLVDYIHNFATGDDAKDIETWKSTRVEGVEETVETTEAKPSEDNFCDGTADVECTDTKADDNGCTTGTCCPTEDAPEHLKCS